MMEFCDFRPKKHNFRAFCTLAAGNYHVILQLLAVPACLRDRIFVCRERDEWTLAPSLKGKYYIGIQVPLPFVFLYREYTVVKREGGCSAKFSSQQPRCH